MDWHLSRNGGRDMEALAILRLLQDVATHGDKGAGSCS